MIGETNPLRAVDAQARVIMDLQRRVGDLERVSGGFGPWVTTFVPQVDQGVTNIAKAVAKSQWRYDGPMVEFEFAVTVTGSGTGGSLVTVALPVAGLSSTNPSMGIGLAYDSSANVRYYGAWEAYPDASHIVLGVDQGNGSGWGATPSIALANGDQLRGLVRYRWK